MEGSELMKLGRKKKLVPRGYIEVLSGQSMIIKISMCSGFTYYKTDYTHL